MATAEALLAQIVARPDGVARKAAPESVATEGGTSFAEVLEGVAPAGTAENLAATPVAAAAKPGATFNAATQLALLADFEAGPAPAAATTPNATDLATPVLPVVPVDTGIAPIVSPAPATTAATTVNVAATPAAAPVAGNIDTTNVVSGSALPAASKAGTEVATSVTGIATETEAGLAQPGAEPTTPMAQAVETLTIVAASPEAVAVAAPVAPATPKPVEAPAAKPTTAKPVAATPAEAATIAPRVVAPPETARPVEATPGIAAQPQVPADPVDAPDAQPNTGASPAATPATKSATSAVPSASADIKPDVAPPPAKTAASATDLATAARTMIATPAPTAAPQTAGAQPAHPALQAAPPVVVQVYARFVERFDGRAQRFEVSLQPAELGRVDVRIEIGADRKVHAILAAHDSNALGDLMRGQRALERALSDAGVDLAKDGLKFELSQDTGRNAAGSQRGDAWAEREQARAWRAFTPVDVPVEAGAADIARTLRPYSRASRLDLVA